LEPGGYHAGYRGFFLKDPIDHLGCISFVVENAFQHFHSFRKVVVVVRLVEQFLDGSYDVFFAVGYFTNTAQATSFHTRIIYQYVPPIVKGIDQF
jgi:hypothetical protein